MPSKSKQKHSGDQDDVIIATVMEDVENGVNFSGLDPLLGSLGELIDLLINIKDDDYSLNTEWFKNPINNIKDGITNRPEKFEAVLAGLLGKVGGNATGIPVKDPALLGTWYPISYKGSATGFYMVSYPKDGEIVLGFGVLHTWKVPPSSGLLNVNVWGLVPFVRIGKGSFKITFTEPGFPIIAGVAAEGADENNPLVDINGVSFNGVKFSASIDLAASNPFSVSLQVLALKLPGDEKPSNRSLADLTAITGEQILETAASLFVGALSKAFPTQDKRIRFLTPLLGMSSTVPGSTVKLPILKWYELFFIASNPEKYPDGAATPFLNWFNTISSDASLLKTWLSCLGGFLQNAEDEVTGEGTRNNPFKVNLLSISSIGKLDFSVGTLVNDEGVRSFYPGLSFRGAPFGFGGSDVVLQLEADLELAEFQLSGKTASIKPTIDFLFRMALQNKDANKPLASFQNYSFGSLRGGLSLNLQGKLVPYFTLNKVIIPPPFGSPPYSEDQMVQFETIDLLSPSELAQKGAEILSSAIKSLLGVVDGGAEGGVSNNIAALIGLTPPALPSGVVWPETLTPPFSPKGMLGSILNPIGAWATYYYNTLQTGALSDGKLAFTYILEQLAQLIQKTTGTVTVTLTGSGTPADPWKAGISLSDTELPAYLTAYQQTVNDKLQLVIGLELAPSLTLASVKIVPSLQLNAISILFPGTGSEDGVIADWLPNVSAMLTLPDGITTPALGGITVGVDAAQLSATWGRTDGWGWSLYVKNPVLTVYGKKVPLGQDLNFSNQTALEDLVKDGSKAFSAFLVSVLGAGLVRSETRAGLLVTGAFGLLNELDQSPIFPNGLTWKGFNQLSISSFTNPWPDIRNLVASNFSTKEKAASLLSLLSWTVNSSMTDAPAISGTGADNDPYRVPMPLGFNIPVWFNNETSDLSAGLGRQDVFDYELKGKKFRFALNTQLRLVEYGLATGSFVANQPTFSFLGTLSNPDGRLVDLGVLGHVDKIDLGFTISIINGSLSFTPVVNLLNVKLPLREEQKVVDLIEFIKFAPELQSSFVYLLNAGVQVAFHFLKEKGKEKNEANSLFSTAYELLTLLGLCIERKKEDDPYGINTAGWQALLADPKNYITGQLKTLFLNAGSRKKLFGFLQTVLHVQLPKLPEPALLLLYGLDICGSPEDGFPLNPQVVLELLSSPVTSIQNRFTALINNHEKLTQITVALAQNIGSHEYGNFTFSSTTNGLVRLEVLPVNAFAIGSFLNLYGALVFDISNLKLSLETDVYCPKVGLTLQSTAGIQYANNTFTPSFTSQMIWGDGSKPSALPLQLFPFNTSTFLDQLAKLAPAYALNLVLNAVFEEELLKKYPLVQKIFTGLGIASDKGLTSDNRLLQANGGFQMDSIMGILHDPLGWLLSDDVLGQNGMFSIPKLIQLLGNLPEVSYKQIKLKPVKGTGVTISGFPYGFEVGMTGVVTGNTGLASFNFGTKEIDIANGTAKLSDLALGITLNENYQPGFTGSFKLGTEKISPAFYTTVSYNNEFGLSINSGTPKEPGAISLQLLPFLGWGKLAAEGAAAAGELLIELMPKLLNYFIEKGGTLGTFVGKMKEFGAVINVNELLTNLIKAIKDGGSQDEILKRLETASLNWLKKRFSKDDAPDTVRGIIELFPEELRKLFSADGGRLAFKPSEKIPVTILAGLNKDGFMGLWADLQLPETELLKISIAETGVGVNLDDFSNVQFSFGVHAIVPLDGDYGPALALKYENGKGFVMNIDPLGDQTNITTPSPLSRQLLPEFFPKQEGDPNTLGERMTNWLLLIVKDVLPQYVSALVLNQDNVKAWLDSPIIKPKPPEAGEATAPTPALLLEAAMLINKKDDRYHLNPWKKLAEITPTTFFGNLLFTLMKSELVLFTFGEKNQCSISIGPREPESDYFGVLVTAPDLKIDALPGLTLQLGATDKDWIDKSGGNKNGRPGLGFYIPIKKDAEENIIAHFDQFSLSLFNIGFDYGGANNKPLVNLERFKIGAVQPRIIFELNFGQDPLITFGAGITLQDIALSLAPNKLAGSGGDNPIASNMLGAGDKDSNEKNPPANPTFSVTAAYNNKLYVNLKSDTGNGTEVIIPVQRGFGPLFVESLGLGWDDANRLLDFIFSGDITLAGLKAQLMGLRVYIPVTDPTNFEKYKVDLEGIDISFKGGSVTLQAGLLKTESPLSYTGLAVIQAASFTLNAVGSYAELPNGQGGTSPSLFIFGALNMPLGGPPAFFIKGVAAGFGFNRGIKIPDISEVQNFPLVRGVMDGTFSSGEDPGSALKKFNDDIYPEVGQYWLAAGLKFTSFQLLNSAGLLFISFGKDFEINLLGLTYASLPPMIDKAYALAYLELALKISFKPAAGIISAEARLTPNSFILSKDCKVTGGFAFYLWYKNITTSEYHISAGDFVITLGGYHPAFKKPLWYPDVPRLGLQWKMETSVGSLGISGGVYFALCPTAVMVGGYLDVQFEAGPLKAWLNAYANMLIEWNPFYFNVGIGITVGVSFGFTVAGVSITLTVELGARLQLEGPPIHGEVEVTWLVISFTIPIGSGKTLTEDKNLTWAAFAESFLPPSEAEPKNKNARSSGLVEPEPVQQVVKWNIGDGLMSTQEDIWLVTPVPFSISVESAIPASQISIKGTDTVLTGKAVGIRPMGYKNSLQSPVTVTVFNSDGKAVALKTKAAKSNNGAPAALWSKEELSRTKAPDANTMLLPDVLFGLVLTSDDYLYYGNLPAFDINNLKYAKANPVRLPFAFVSAYGPALRYPAEDQNRAYSVIKSSIMAEAVIAKRNEVLKALSASNINAPQSPNLTVMAASANLVLQAMPVIARVGIYQNGGKPDNTKPKRMPRAVRAQAKETETKQPKLVGTLKRYTNQPASRFSTLSVNHHLSVNNQWSLMSGDIKKTGFARLAGEPSASKQILYNGGLSVWEVDDQLKTKLRLTGSLPVTVSCFNRYGEFLSFHNFSMQGGNTRQAVKTFTLPAETAQLVVQGCESVTGIRGCQHDTMMCKVTNAWIAGDNMLLRVQNSQRIATRSPGAQKGLVEMQELLAKNLCTGPGNTLVQGWVQAVFPSGSRFIGVLLDNKSATEDDLAVSIEYGTLPVKPGLNKPVEIQAMPNGTLFVYEAPSAENNKWLGLLLKTTGSEIKVTAISGMQEFGEWQKHTHLPLEYAAINLADSNFSTTKMSITSK